MYQYEANVDNGYLMFDEDRIVSTRVMREEDARLFAAASDLLEAAKHVADELHGQSQDIRYDYFERTYFSQLTSTLQEAIQKADG